MNIHALQKKKSNGEKISMITCYEAWAAQIVEKTPVDAILVGDSINMVMYGQTSTLTASMNMMVRHIKAVAPFAPSKIVVGDLPFLSYRLDLKSNVLNAGALMKAGAHAVKLEGAKGNLDLVSHLVASGIPVMGHLGLTPQSVNTLGGYRVQGRDAAAGEELLKDAKALESAGAFALVLECVPKPLAQKITKALKIPTIGIGAGNETDGQVLVWHDFLGLQDQVRPRFVRRFLEGGALIEKALQQYCDSVKSGEFPNDQESFLE